MELNAYAHVLGGIFIVTHVTQCAQVILTDYPDAALIQNLEHNVERNIPLIGRNNVHVTVSYYLANFKAGYEYLNCLGVYLGSKTGAHISDTTSGRTNPRI
jgi:hypothetical protein